MAHTILLVDDEPVILEVVSEILKDFFDYDVIVAHGGIAGVDRYKDHWHEIDCVVLDMMMPDMKGCEVYEHMKEINPNVKVVIMSGYCDDADRKRVLDCGCGFIQKPAKPNEIQQAILNMIGAPVEQES